MGITVSIGINDGIGHIAVASNAVAPSSSVSPPTHPLPLQLTPVLGSLIGIGTALILAALIIVLIMRFRDQDRHNRRSSATEYDKAAVPLHADADDSFDLKDKKSRIETGNSIFMILYNVFNYYGKITFRCNFIRQTCKHQNISADIINDYISIALKIQKSYLSNFLDKSIIC